MGGTLITGETGYKLAQNIILLFSLTKMLLLLDITMENCSHSKSSFSFDVS